MGRLEGRCGRLRRRERHRPASAKLFASEGRRGGRGRSRKEIEDTPRRSRTPVDARWRSPPTVVEDDVAKAIDTAVKGSASST